MKLQIDFIPRTQPNGPKWLTVNYNNGSISESELDMAQTKLHIDYHYLTEPSITLQFPTDDYNNPGQTAISSINIQDIKLIEITY